MFEKLIKIKICSDSMEDIKSLVNDIKQTVKQKEYSSKKTEIKKMWMIDYVRKTAYNKRRWEKRKQNEGNKNEM
jgi:hypothetical protein